MPTYTTLPPGADLMQNKTHAFVIVSVSGDVDLGYWWQKTGGSASEKLKVTLLKPNGTTVEKLAESGEVDLVNTNPPSIKVLIAPSDINFVGNLRIFAEFKIDDSWIQSDVVTMSVTDDPIPEA